MGKIHEKAIYCVENFDYTADSYFLHALVIVYLLHMILEIHEFQHFGKC